MTTVPSTLTPKSQAKANQKAPAKGPAQLNRVHSAPKVWDKSKAPSAADVVERIPIVSIDVGANDRISEDRDAIEQLAQSMAADGQLQPIGVAFKTGLTKAGEIKTYQLIYGHRRIAAAKLMGWTEILAKIYPGDMVGAQFHAIRLAENSQRENLTAVEESLATARLLNAQAAIIRGGEGTPKFDLLVPAGKKKAIEVVAEKLGKSVEWVTDRAYLTRLSDAGVEALTDRRMPVHFAREICKIADHEEQDEVISDIASEDSDGPVKCSFDELQHMVGSHVFNLAKAPWKLSLPFAGKPACDGCQYNSIDTPDLFGDKSSFSDHPRTGEGRFSDRQIPTQGVCTNAGCYRTKFAEASKLLSNASAKAVKLIEEEPKTKQDAAVGRVAKEVAPPALRTEAVADRIRERRERSSNRPKQPKSTNAPTASQIQKLAENKAKQEWGDACSAACKALEPKIAKALKARPGLWIIFHLITQTKLYQSTQALNDKTSQVVNSPSMKAMLARLKNPGWDDVVALEKECGLNYDLLEYWYDGRSGIAAKFAEALGIEFTQPKLEDFIAKAKKELEKGGKP